VATGGYNGANDLIFTDAYGNVGGTLSVRANLAINLSDNTTSGDGLTEVVFSGPFNGSGQWLPPIPLGRTVITSPPQTVVLGETYSMGPVELTLRSGGSGSVTGRLTLGFGDLAASGKLSGPIFTLADGSPLPPNISVNAPPIGLVNNRIDDSVVPTKQVSFGLMKARFE